MKSVTIKKAERIYTEGKVKFISSKGTSVKFIVEGDTKHYGVTYFRLEKKWTCECESFKYRLSCSHILSCQLLLQHEKESIGL